MSETPDLSSCVALVAGASRGVGRGVALALGEAGATVVVTGRTLKSARRRDAPGNIDETAREVSRLGGRGVAVQTDHTRVEDVRELVEAVRQREGGLDLLVNAVWGGGASDARPVWEQPLARWDATLRAGVWAALLTTRFAAPLLTASAGLVTTVAAADRGDGSLFEGLAAGALRQLAAELAEDFRPSGVTSVAVVPGRARTERRLAEAGATERTWTRAPELAGTESPRYAGRAIAALAADPARFTQTGRTLRVAELAARYAVTDLDGIQPGLTAGR